MTFLRLALRKELRDCVSSVCRGCKLVKNPSSHTWMAVPTDPLFLLRTEPWPRLAHQRHHWTMRLPRRHAADHTILARVPPFSRIMQEAFRLLSLMEGGRDAVLVLVTMPAAALLIFRMRNSTFADTAVVQG